MHRDLKPAAKGQPAELLTLELCPNFNLRVAERLVTVEGEGVTEFFNRAEDVEGCKASTCLYLPLQSAATQVNMTPLQQSYFI